MNQQVAGPEFLTLAQAAEIVGTSERTVRRLIDSGSLPAFRVGVRAVRVRADDVRAQAKPIPAGGAK